MTNFTAAAPQSVFTEDGCDLTRLPKNYYATKTYTDRLIGYIDANHGDGRPFFAYVSHQAPDDLQMDVFMISLVSGWHPLIEGSKRLKSE
jgi:hypothetical protein